MKVIDELWLSHFNFWGPAKSNVAELTESELDVLDEILSDMYQDGIDATELNDIFAYDFEWVCSLIGKEIE